MKKALVILGAFLAVIASAGCINYGSTSHAGFYIVVGILNLALTGFLAYREFKASKDE